IGVLAAMLLPALSAARESSRSVTCSNNLRQFGIGLQSFAERNDGVMCSGAFNWYWDGPITEVGWVADLNNFGTPVGEMLCPSNPAETAEAISQFVETPVSSLTGDDCVERKGSKATTLPDGTTQKNPCRELIEGGYAPLSSQRVNLAINKLFEKSFNTNYTASWFLARGGVVLEDGELTSDRPTDCPASLKSRNSTKGPLNQALLDASPVSNVTVPLLGCGTTAGVLRVDVGEYLQAGTQYVYSMTGGPRENPTMQTPATTGMPKDGAIGVGWWATWNATVQDYRAFAPVHQRTCNILFADGSVRAFTDENDDDFLNSGFTPSAANPFQSDELELAEEKVFSGYKIQGE
ncbi:MAG: DUF1559 domain-containing protein, partial [Planctomycetales bacterium]|nr:DUF1559 domain-containing protein [Planctomycetales bacterium]